MMAPAMVPRAQSCEMGAAIGGLPTSTEPASDEPPDPASARRRPPTGRWLAAVFSVGVLLLVASPVVENWTPEPRDSVPLSYYPQLTEPRADRQRLTYLVGLDARGGRSLIPYRFAGTGDLDQVRLQIDRLVDGGQAVSLCRAVAARLGQAAGPLPALSTIEVITGTYQLSAAFGPDRAPLEEVVRARCAPARATAP